jgi:AGZA family xanthine/uracil permease-like MFS transporter
VLVARRTRGAILLGHRRHHGLRHRGGGRRRRRPVVRLAGGEQPARLVAQRPVAADAVFDVPDLSLIGQVSLFGGFARVGVIAAVLLVFTLMLADFFDTMGTVVGVGQEAGPARRGGPPARRRPRPARRLGRRHGRRRGVRVVRDDLHRVGGRCRRRRPHGLASVVTGVLFLGALLLTPLVTIVPFEAASPALVIVGFLLLTQVRNIDFDDYAIAIPAFLTIVLMPFTYSITNGIGAGFVSYAVLKATQGKAREVSPLLWVIAALFVVYFAIDPIEAGLVD